MAELQRRNYLVWFDLERMKGSVMDAMSEAVEGAEVILYGVSEKYKERCDMCLLLLLLLLHLHLHFVCGVRASLC